MITLIKYPKATTITIYSLGFFLGLLHIFFGVITLTPIINRDYHREMTITYNAFAKSLSFLYQFLNKASLTFYLRHIVAAFQVIFGAMLLENGHFGSFGKIGNCALIFVDISFLLLQLSVGSSYERIAPTIVFTVLLITRLLIAEQGSKKAKVGVKTRNAGKQKTSTPKKNKNE